MKKIFKYILTAGLVAMTAACDMNLQPTDSVVVENGKVEIRTGQELFSFYMGILSNFRAVHNGYFYTTEELMLDGFNATSSYGNNYGDVHRVEIKAGDDYIESFWSDHYTVIKNYNILIDALHDYIPEGYEADANDILGNAFLFRADAYLQLIRHFAPAYRKDDIDDTTGSLGVPLVVHYSLSERPARATIGEVYEQIVEDLDSAYVRLKEVPGEIGALTGTIDAVRALQARAALDMGDYKLAVAKTDTLIKSKIYSLASTAAAMETEFREDGGNEPIMQMAANKSDEKPSSISVYTNCGSSLQYSLCFKSLYLPSEKLVNAYSDGDLRKASWFTNSLYYTEVNGSYYRGDFYTFIKYLGNPELYSGKTPDGTQAVKPYTISEIYLINAEANAQGGDRNAAKTSLNVLQNARKATATSGSLGNIKNEWFKETVGQGLRLSCLKRWGDGYEERKGQAGAIRDNALMTGDRYTEKSLDADDYHLVWPIPAHDMRLNPNLIQNPGYGTAD
ncbi:MAG: RagB/SusD family nutrient uptake outer membrane protein [Bacteroidales bacterium]|nr:RagB/SusD family nutrient uptake outer membrane protein [Bacteroidales bacterium]